jgi:hypothetical protein
MIARQRLMKAEKILATAGTEMHRSCALYAMWAGCNNHAVLDNITGTKAARGFSFVRDALYRDLVVTLLTVLEKGQDGSACIPALLKITNDPEVVELMKAKSMRPDEVEGRILSAKQGFKQLEGDGMLRSLRKLRNKAIAHVEHRDVKHGAKYGDERKVLERTIPVFEDLAVAVRDREYHFVRLRDSGWILGLHSGKARLGTLLVAR